MWASTLWHFKVCTFDLIWSSLFSGDWRSGFSFFFKYHEATLRTENVTTAMYHVTITNTIRAQDEKVHF